LDVALISSPILRAITNLASGKDSDSNQFVNYDLFESVRHILTNGVETSQYECLALLANVSASALKFKCVIPLVPIIIQIVESQLETPRLHGEAAWVLANLTSHEIDTVDDDGRILSIVISHICTTRNGAVVQLKIMQTIWNILASGDDPNSQYKYRVQPLLPNKYGIKLSGLI
jgi:hypothetical protein